MALFRLRLAIGSRKQSGMVTQPVATDLQPCTPVSLRQSHSAVITATDNRLPMRADGDRIDFTLMTSESPPSLNQI